MRYKRYQKVFTLAKNFKLTYTRIQCFQTIYAQKKITDTEQNIWVEISTYNGRQDGESSVLIIVEFPRVKNVF